MNLDYSKPVQWKEGDRHHIGRIAIVRYSPTTTGHCKRDVVGVAFMEKGILVKHAHTGELEFVSESKLSPYPSQPIEEPTR